MFGVDKAGEECKIGGAEFSAGDSLTKSVCSVIIID